MNPRHICLINNALALLACLWAAGPARASGPFLTDDAAITTGTVQVETWYRTGAAGWETWALPEVQVIPNLELTLGVGTIARGGEVVEDFVLQGKTLIRPLAVGDWGIGLTLGAPLRASGRPQGSPRGNFYAYVPLSWSMFEERLVLHHNLGYLYNPASDSPHDVTWNFVAEVALHERLALAAEIYGDILAVPFYQTGLRWWLNPELALLDLTVIGQLGGSPQISQGLSLSEIIQREPNK